MYISYNCFCSSLSAFIRSIEIVVPKLDSKLNADMWSSCVNKDIVTISFHPEIKLFQISQVCIFLSAEQFMFMHLLDVSAPQKKNSWGYFQAHGKAYRSSEFRSGETLSSATMFINQE